MGFRILLWSITSALAGFLFGFDTVVISGAEQRIQSLWNLSAGEHGFAMASALYGTVLGSLLGGWPTDRFGRRATLFWIGILYVISALGCAVASGVGVFIAARIIGGFGIGISTVAAPLYIAEIAPPAWRGRLAGMFQFNIVFGIVVAFLSNSIIDKNIGGEQAWRWMLGVLAIPSLIYTIMVMAVPESPRWLVSVKKDLPGARKAMELIGAEDPDTEIRAIQEADQSIGSGAKKESIFSKKYGRVLGLAFFVAFFNQLSGINFILYYAPEILSQIGLGAKESLGNSIAIGGVNLIFTFVGLYLIDRLGRKTLLLIGSIGYIVSLAMVAYAFSTHAGSTFLMVFLLLFIASHAVGQGAVIWVLIAEVFPNRVRALGQSFGASTHWVFAAIITQITPLFLDREKGIFGDNPWPIFAFFAAMMVLQLIWVLTKVPETKGVSLEELEKKLIR